MLLKKTCLNPYNKPNLQDLYCIIGLYLDTMLPNM